MTPDAERLVSDALKLPAKERAELVDRLLQSLNDEEGAALDDLHRERLHAAIGRSEHQFRAGQTISSKAVLDRLRKRRVRSLYSPATEAWVDTVNGWAGSLSHGLNANRIFDYRKWAAELPPGPECDRVLTALRDYESGRLKRVFADFYAIHLRASPCLDQWFYGPNTAG